MRAWLFVGKGERWWAKGTTYACEGKLREKATHTRDHRNKRGCTENEGGRRGVGDGESMQKGMEALDITHREKIVIQVMKVENSNHESPKPVPFQSRVRKLCGH